MSLTDIVLIAHNGNNVATYISERLIIGPMEEDGSSAHYQPMMLNTGTLRRYRTSHTMVNPEGLHERWLTENGLRESIRCTKKELGGCNRMPS